MELPTLGQSQDEVKELTPPGSLAVNEIFYSLQGEGKYSGYPMVFIRLNICHVGCRFCDTKYSWQTLTHNVYYDAPTILAKVKECSEKCNRVCITGGEPFEQAEALLEVCKYLKAHGLKVHIETSGNVLIDKEFREYCHWITCSPKKFYPPNFESPIDEIKFLVVASADLAKIRNWIGTFKRKVWVSIQPIEPDPSEFGNPEGLEEDELAELHRRVKQSRNNEQDLWEKNKARAVEICLQTGWQLSFQTHKYFKIR